jgi:serine/threonine-protein kinase
MSVSLTPGDIVDRYTVESLLGEGGMAAVYAVRHNTLGSSHALKLLKIENDSVRQRLVAEGKVQASLRHPNIVAVTDVILVKGQPALVMEKIDGPDLHQWLQENRPSVEDAVRLFRGILAGVSRAHRAGLVHRDLKPSNVLLDSADGLIIPKVADFGLAKILADEDGGHSQTRSGSALGTPQFMAPEQIRNAKDVDQRADIFALGCILYVLVCGRLPFEDPDLLELYNKIASGRFTPPESLVPGLPPHIGDALRACLQVDRAQRAQDCDAVRALLFDDEQVLTGGVRIAPTSELRPARRSEKLVPASTRYAPDSVALPAPFAASRTAVPAAPASMASSAPSRLSIGVLVFAGSGLVVVAGLFLLVAAFALGGFGSFGGAPTAPVVALAPPPVAAPVAPEAAPVPTLAAEAAPVPTLAADVAPVRPAPSPVAAGVGSAVAVRPKVTPKDALERPAAAPEAATGEVRVSGTVESLTLHANGKTYSPGNVPEGTYEVRFTFAGRSEQQLSGVRVRAGEQTVLACDARFANCSVR